MLNATGVAQTMTDSGATFCKFVVESADPYFTGLACPTTDTDDNEFTFNTATPVATTDFEKITIESETNIGN
jgi:hypothetical protein